MPGSLLSGNFNIFMLAAFLLQIPIVLLSLSAHEAAHGYIAYKMGDPTARNLGRLTLNPLKHLDPIGTVCMLLAGYGWAKPVPINTRNFHNPKKGMALTALAGPMSNLLLAVIFNLLRAVFLVVSFYLPTGEKTELLMTIINTFFYWGVYMNISLAVFNLIPIPPFDGSRIFLSFLPPKMYFGIMKYERYILIGTLALLYLGVLSFPITFITEGIIALFDMAAYAVIGLLI